jgi:hypothetical protein
MGTLSFLAVLPSSRQPPLPLHRRHRLPPSRRAADYLRRFRAECRRRLPAPTTSPVTCRSSSIPPMSPASSGPPHRHMPATCSTPDSTAGASRPPLRCPGLLQEQAPRRIGLRPEPRATVPRPRTTVTSSVSCSACSTIPSSAVPSVMHSCRRPWSPPPPLRHHRWPLPIDTPRAIYAAPTQPLALPAPISPPPPPRLLQERHSCG